MATIKLPRIYLIKRDAVQSDAVQHALSIAPASDILCVNADDAKAVEESTLPRAMIMLHEADVFAIVADGFEHDLAVLNDDSSLEILCPSQEKSKTS